MNSPYSLQALFHSLPPAPKATGKSIVTPIIYGITAEKGQELVSTQRVDGDWVKVPNPRVDLRHTNAARSRRLKFNTANAGFLERFNKAVAGGEDYPILSGLLGIGVGMFSAGAGVLFSLTTMAVSSGRNVQPIRARLGDEIWSLEVVSKGPVKDGSSTLLHTQYFVLVDPFRQKDTQVPSEWVFHESRTQLVI